MSEIESSGSVDFTNPETPDSGVLYDAAVEKAAIQEARTEAQLYDHGRAMSWAEATAKDDKGTKNRHSPPAQTHRHGRSNWRARQDWQRTVRGVRRQTLAHSHAPDASPSMKGGGGFWGPLREWLDGLLGIR